MVLVDAVETILSIVRVIPFQINDNIRVPKTSTILHCKSLTSLKISADIMCGAYVPCATLVTHNSCEQIKLGEGELIFIEL
jgi:hypothetical protein